LGLRFVGKEVDFHKEENECDSRSFLVAIM